MAFLNCRHKHIRLLLFISIGIFILGFFFYLTVDPTSDIKLPNVDHTSIRIMSDEFVLALQQRTIAPKKCNNSDKYERYNNNWAPYLHRCNKLWGGTPKGIGEGIITKEIVYTHVFKAGGTTIQIGLNKLVRDNKLINLTVYNGSRPNKYQYPGGGPDAIKLDQYYSFIDSNTFVFSFIREPISKFLSGFYEANRRISAGEAKPKIGTETNGLNATEIMRKWIEIMLPKYVNGTRQSATYINWHLAPNIASLQRPTNNIGFHFIGNLKHLSRDMPLILEPFIADQQLLNNASLLMERYFRHARGRNIVSNFSIAKSQLNDRDIANLCKIYWWDYMCFPFEIPMQCKNILIDLFRQHYNSDISYKLCY